MPLASEDKKQLRDIYRVLTEIRDALKNPPERISGEIDINKILRAHQKVCTCGESKAPCPVHEPG